MKRRNFFGGRKNAGGWSNGCLRNAGSVHGQGDKHAQARKTKGEYYVLSPIDDPGSTVYVPTASEKLANKLRPVLTGSEANALIDEAANEPLEWITSDNERKSVCDDIVKNGSRKQLMQLVGMLYRRRAALKDQKKHFHNVDAQYLKTAERMLHGELAYALGIAAADVAEYIRRRMAGCDT